MNYRNPRIYRAASLLLFGSVVGITSIVMAKSKEDVDVIGMPMLQPAVAIQQQYPATQQSIFIEKTALVAPWQVRQVRMQFSERDVLPAFPQQASQQAHGNTSLRFQF